MVQSWPKAEAFGQWLRTRHGEPTYSTVGFWWLMFEAGSSFAVRICPVLCKRFKESLASGILDARIPHTLPTVTIKMSPDLAKYPWGTKLHWLRSNILWINSALSGESVNNLNGCPWHPRYCGHGIRDRASLGRVLCRKLIICSGGKGEAGPAQQVNCFYVMQGW